MHERANTPVDLLKSHSSAAAEAYLRHKAAVMENPELRAISTKTKPWIGIGIAAALQSSVCTRMWVRLAREAGATNAEVAEAIAVSGLMKAATVNDTALDAIAWLPDHPGASGSVP